MANPFALEMLSPEVLRQLQAGPSPAMQGAPVAGPRPVTAEEFMDQMARQGMPYEDARFQLRLKQAELEGSQQDAAQQQGLAAWQTAMAQAKASMPQPAGVPTPPAAQAVPTPPPAASVPSPVGADDQYAQQGQAFREAFQAGVPPVQFNVSDSTTLADYAKAKQAEQAAANAGATPEILREMNQGTWFGSSGGSPQTAKSARDAALQRRRARESSPEMVDRRENLRRARLRPDLRAQEVMDEENVRQAQQFEQQVAAEKQVEMMRALAGIAGNPNFTGSLKDAMKSLEQVGGVPVPEQGGDGMNLAKPLTEEEAPLQERYQAAGGVHEFLTQLERDSPGYIKKHQEAIVKFLTDRHGGDLGRYKIGESGIGLRKMFSNPRDAWEDYNGMLKRLGLPPVPWETFSERSGSWTDWLGRKVAS